MVSVKASAVRLLLMVGLALVPIASYSLGLGRLKVNSALNEPLNAEIDFTSVSEKELKGLKVNLAPRADFLSVGTERAPILTELKFTVAKRLDGRYFIQLHTEVPFPEPFLHLLVKVEWVNGQIVREYTALIDPPYLIAGKPGGVQLPGLEPGETSDAREESLAAQSLSVEPMSQAAETSGIGGPDAASEVAALSSELSMNSMPDVPVAPDEISSAAVGAPMTAPRAERRRPPQASVRVIDPVGYAAPNWTNAAEYRVKRGDTLWGIAQRVRADSQVSVQQVILAIYKNNPDAFFRNNVNNLRSGKILRMPERESVTAISKTAALKEFRAQYDVWQEYKIQLAGASEKIKVVEAPSPAESAAPAPKIATRAARAESKPKAAKSGEASAPAKPKEPKKAVQAPDAVKPEQAPKKTDVAKPAQETKPEEGTTPSEELLKIVRATLGAEQSASPKKQSEAESAKDADSKERRVLQDRVTTLEESIESKEMETKDLSAKVGQVRDQLKNESRLIEIENQKLAKAQQAPAPEVKTAPAPSPPPAEKPKAETPAEPPKAVAPAKPAPAAPPVRAKTQKPPPRSSPAAPPPPPPAEKGVVASLMEELSSDSLLFPILGGGIVLIGGGIFLVYLRRRQKSIAEFEESILASDAIAADTGTNLDMSSAPAVTTGDTSFLSDFSQTGMGNIHTDEVDPVAEADVYLAYGRDETAEEILRDAIVKHPERQELKQKLLEIYHQRNDVGAFETLAEELYAALGGGGGKMWEKIEEMGRKLNPNNPMFQGGGAPGLAGAGAVGAGSRVDDISVTAVASPRSDAPESSLDANSLAGGLDFDLDSVDTPVDPVSPAASIDFDLDLTAEAAADNAAGAKSPEESLEAALDFSTDAEKSDGELDIADISDVSDNMVSFDSADAQSDVADLDVSSEDLTPDSGIQWDAGSETAAEQESDTAVETAASDEGQLQQWDETATKLDLAKAYIDMGDAEGARSILDEVLAEGTEDQKKQAAELATQLS